MPIYMNYDGIDGSYTLSPADRGAAQVLVPHTQTSGAPTFQGGVRVATGDVNVDIVPDIVQSLYIDNLLAKPDILKQGFGLLLPAMAPKTAFERALASNSKLGKVTLGFKGSRKGLQATDVSVRTVAAVPGGKTLIEMTPQGIIAILIGL